MSNRYSSVAISLHWLIAFFIIGLIAMGKYMTHLDDNDPLRYTLTQLHKSAGITVLLLVVFRVFWRLTHTPPALPATVTGFEKVASSLTHAALYLLMVIVPVSGWVMVSVSPIRLETFLYGVVPWPHIPFLTTLADDNSIVAARSALAHTWLGNTVLALVALHAVAALFHQWYRRDHLLSRMTISASHRRKGDLNHGLVVGVLIVFAGSIFLANAVTNPNASGKPATTASPQTVTTTDTLNDEALVAPLVAFTAKQMGEPVIATFRTVQATLSMDRQQPRLSTLTATVLTASVATDDTQVQSTMVTADWFASEEFPQATFESTQFEQKSDTTFQVTGDLTIRDKTQSVGFELSLEAGIGRGEFTVNRIDFGIGDNGQDEFVEPQVQVRFEVQDEG